MKGLLFGCLFSFMTAVCGEACPDFLSAKIENRQIKITNFESARIASIEKAVLTGKVFDIDIKTALFTDHAVTEKAIPAAAGKIRLLGCEYDLPPDNWTAFFHSERLVDIRKPWWSFLPDELQRAMMLIVFAPDGKSFYGRIWYVCCSGNKTWKHKTDFSCLITADGKLLERTGDDYSASKMFRIVDKKLYINLQVTGKRYKYLKQKEFVFYGVRLPVQNSLRNADMAN